MENTVYSYGGGEALFKVLNGVKMIFDSDLTKDLTYLMTFVGLAWAAFQGAQQNSWAPKLSWLTKYVLITSLFITPTATLWVTDVVYGTRNKVDGLPIGLVLPASVFSGIGFGVTQLFDQAFSSVDNIPYTKYGQSFGAALISQSRNFKIQDSGFRENIESFIDNCMLYDVMVGRKYSASELKDEKNIWNLVSENASNIRMMNYRDDQKKLGRRLVTCREGAGLLNNYWTKDITKLGERFGSTIFGKYGSQISQAIGNSNQEVLGKSFLANINVVSNLYGKSTGATDTLKQIMMINAISDIPLSYGAVRAKQQQQESWLISGQLAREILPTLHAIFAALIYASFTLIIGMLVLPGGFKTLANYFGLLIWIETWPPLFAVINLLTNISTKTYGGDFTSITMNSASQIISHNNNISVVASGMMIVLPYLSYNILKGGAGQFVHLASQVMGASQSAAMAASNEVTSGNRSLDNVSMMNGQWSNKSGFKTDMNMSYRAGHSERQLSDGMIVKETSDGRTILQSGPGITTSVGSESTHMAVSNSSQDHQSLSHEKSLLTSEQFEHSQTKQLMVRSAADFVKNYAVHEASGTNYNYDQTSADGKIFHDAVTKTKQLQDHHGYTHNQSSGIGVGGSVGANASVGGTAKHSNNQSEAIPSVWGGGGSAPVSAGGSAGIEASASGSANHINDQSISEDKGASTSLSVEGQAEAIARVAKSMHFGDTQTHDKSLADSLTGSYEKVKNQRNSIAVHQDNIDRYQSSSDNTQASSYTVGEDIYHKKLDYFAKQRDQFGFPIGEIEAAKIIEKKGSRYDEYDKGFQAKYLPSQKMLNHNFDYKKAVAETMPQEDLEQGYKAAAAEITAEGPKVQINKQAQQEYLERSTDNAIKIDVSEEKIMDNGNYQQKQANQAEKDRPFYSKWWFGMNKNEDETFKN
jgi:conjugal transfer mating pair stabilization protein TraG